MCRIDPEIHDAPLERKGSRTVVMKGRKYRGYVYVEAEADQSARETDRRVYPRTALVNLELVNATQSGQIGVKLRRDVLCMTGVLAHHYQRSSNRPGKRSPTGGGGESATGGLVPLRTALVRCFSRRSNRTL